VRDWYKPSCALIALVLVACSCSSSSSHKATSKTASTTASTSAVSPAASVAAAPSPGCRDTANAVTPGQEQVTLTSGGAARSYYRHVPPTYQATTPMPLVFDFHGYSEASYIQTLVSGLGPFGDQHGFVTVTPQGSGAIPLWNTTLHSDDMKFFGQLLDQVEQTVCVDQNRVFATGLSNGAFMTSAVACEYADRVAAAAPVAGIRNIKGCRPARPVPVVAFHGTADPLVAYTGGLGPKGLALPAPDGSGRTLGQTGTSGLVTKDSVPKMTADWAARNHCAPRPTTTKVASDVTLIAYRCPDDATVELYRIEGGGHTWPGSAVTNAVPTLLGPTTLSIAADEVIWKFFQDHPLRPATRH
jgi:polyhydroxybutyrate depolymerase